MQQSEAAGGISDKSYFREFCGDGSVVDKRRTERDAGRAGWIFLCGDGRGVVEEPADPKVCRNYYAGTLE